ncbi:hypothetical protein BDZ97DRAFT_1918729 [Flammula alnicola]|nr:hypothetical protein BDZ97DRAFT_1918729 [Flammula alnicola]
MSESETKLLNKVATLLENQLEDQRQTRKATEDLLNRIATLLENQRQTQETAEDGQKQKDAIQLYSGLSVVGSIIASLSLSLLTYAASLAQANTLSNKAFFAVDLIWFVTAGASLFLAGSTGIVAAIFGAVDPKNLNTKGSKKPLRLVSYLSLSYFHHLPSSSQLIDMTKDNGAAQWTTEDEVTFIDFLLLHAAAAGDGGNFKMVTFNAAAPVVEAKRVKGGPKTAKACQNKYNSLRRTFRAIQAIKNRSGWTWSDETGASITPEMEDTWSDFLKVHKDAKPFKNKGWVHLEKVSLLMPATVKGKHVFRPSQGLSGMDPFDEDDDDLPPFPANTQVDEDTPDEEIGHLEVVASSAPIIPSTPPRASRKRERAVSETPAPAKKAKVTGADAIQSLTASISRFGDNICKALAGDPSEKTPKRHTKAVKLAQKEDWLPMADRLILCNVLEKDIKAADAYTALDADDVEFRQMWIQEKVEEVRVLRAAA